MANFSICNPLPRAPPGDSLGVSDYGIYRIDGGREEAIEYASGNMETMSEY